MRLLPLLALTLLSSSLLSAQPHLFDEQFTSNARSWHVGSDAVNAMEVADGLYRVSWRMPGRDWFTDRPASIDPSKDYTIEMALRLVSGSTNVAFGLMWGEDNARLNLFGLSGDGHAKVATYNAGWTDVVGWTRSGSVKMIGETNVLRVERRGDRIEYFVNDTKVAETHALPLYSSDVGIYVQETMVVELDYITVEQDRPPINVVPGAPTSIEKINLGPNVNTPYNDFGPVISADGRTLYYTIQNNPENTGGEKDLDEIWISTATSDSTWGMRQRAPVPLNNVAPNWIFSVTPDNNTVLLLNTYHPDGSNRGGGFSMARRSATGWDAPVEVVVRNFVNRTNYNTLCLSPNRKVLVIAIEGPITQGRHDLYVSFLGSDGTWTEPANMGTTLNTFGAEYSPFLAADGVTLYFSSDGHRGYGSGDIFMARRLDDSWQNWSTPLNLGPALNTVANEGGFTIPASGRYAYLVSSDNAIGSGDIFRLRLPAAVAPEPVVLVSGRVLDTKTKKPLGAEITYRDLASDREIGAASSSPADGEYRIVLPAGRVYSFMANRSGYYAVSDNLDVASLGEYTEIRRDLYLTPVEVGSTIRLNNLFFDTGRWELRAESFPELNRAVAFLVEHPSIRIEVGGHTDNVGSDVDNRTLSENRVRSVVAYLAERGIDTKRITSRGYGESRPIATNDTDEGRQQNRRVEFTIVKR
jgi:outer membrane protein OmpA-like peptidoglycan-associated protein